MRKKRSPAALLRLRNKELKEAREQLSKVRNRAHSLKDFDYAVQEAKASPHRLGDHIRVSLPPKLTFGSVFRVDIQESLLFLKDM